MTVVHPPSRKRGSRALLCLACIALLLALSWPPEAQQPSATRTPGDPKYFTGRTYSLDTAGIRMTRNGFEAGARANWHIHTDAQLVFVQEGAMRVQIEGQPMRELRLHETAFLPGGIPHWHGAGLDRPATQVAIGYSPGGPNVMERVTDEQYAGRAPRR